MVYMGKKHIWVKKYGELLDFWEMVLYICRKKEMEREIEKILEETIELSLTRNYKSAYIDGIDEAAGKINELMEEEYHRGFSDGRAEAETNDR